MNGGSRGEGGLAVIPARGGSKRIPRKNARPFLGIPLVVRSIALAFESDAVDRVVVSTDDQEIAELAREAGAEVPFIRPGHLADDHAGTVPVMAHAVAWLADQGPMPDAVLCLYPGAVLTPPGELLKARSRLGAGVDYVASVTTYDHPPQRALRALPSGAGEFLDAATRLQRTQDLEELFHDAGQFYWGTCGAWRDERPVFGHSTMLHRLSRERVQDIDTEEDWVRAELLFRALEAS